jgi:hypothetical protein
MFFKVSQVPPTPLLPSLLDIEVFFNWLKTANVSQLNIPRTPEAFDVGLTEGKGGWSQIKTV